jgi:Ca2+/Na+ antiporter
LIVNFDELDEQAEPSSPNEHWRRLPHGLKALVGLRPSGAAMRENYTCAYYHAETGTWRRDGMRLVSRNFDQHGYILCETSHLSVFALLPESMFEVSSSLTEVLTTAVPLVSGAIAILATLFLLLAASLQSWCLPRRGDGRMVGTDPALLLLLLTTLLLHSIHLVLLLLPGFGPMVAQSAEVQLYLLQQYSVLSLTALFALINFTLYERAVEVETEVIEVGSGGSYTTLGPKRQSWCRRFSLVSLWAILLPVTMCIITWLRSAYIYSGAISGDT